jgi:hypothetical protein
MSLDPSLAPLALLAPLAACASCARHVRTSDAACPFCHATMALADDAKLPRAAPAMRLGRAARHAFGIGALSVTALVSACAHEDDTAMVTIYGGPPPELTQSPADAGVDGPVPAPRLVAPVPQPPKPH